MKRTKEQAKINSQYEAKVAEAKEIASMLRLGNKQRMRVAEIAVEVCVITHGGKEKPSRYTLKRFANDIKINNDTLYEWVRSYRYVYNKLKPEQKEVFHEFPAHLLRDTIKGLSESAKPGIVQRRFQAAVSKGRDSSKMKKYIQNLSAILFNVSNHSRLIDVDDNTLIELYRKASLIRGFLDYEFEARKMKVKPIIKQPKIDTTKFWHDEIEGVE